MSFDFKVYFNWIRQSENENIKNKNKELEEENKQLKTTLEETSPLYELLKNKFGDQFEEWKNNLFKSFRSKIKPKQLNSQ